MNKSHSPQIANTRRSKPESSRQKKSQKKREKRPNRSQRPETCKKPTAQFPQIHNRHEARAHLERGSRQDETHNCKAMLENPSTRPLGNPEPQPTLSKDKCGTGPKIATCEACFLQHTSAKFRFLARFFFGGGRDKTFLANPSNGHF